MREALTGQVAVAQKSGETINAFTGVQIAPALDAIYAAKAAQASYGVGWNDAGKPTFALWAPTAKDVTLLSWNTRTPRGADPEVSGAPVRTAATRTDDGRWSVDNAEVPSPKGPSTCGRCASTCPPPVPWRLIR